MKKIILFITAIVFTQFTSLNAQEVEVQSAFRNSQNIYQGSARFMGMGGAFTALGADISAISLNPAGVGVYTGFQMEFTPAYHYQQTNTRTMSYKNEEFNYNLNLNNLGLAGAYNLKSPGWKTINFSVGYNRMNNFNKQVNSSIFNRDRSKTHEFVENANSGNYRELFEGLAEQTRLIQYDSIYTFEYWSQPRDEMEWSDTTSQNVEEIGVNQQKNLDHDGALNEYFFALGANYNNTLYLGLSVGIQKVNFSYKNTYGETEQDNQISGVYDLYSFHGMTFTQYEEHTGTGYNFKLGAIYRPTDFIRIGAAFHSPTYFNDLSYSYYNSMLANYTDGDNLQATSQEYNWAFQLTTPSRLLGGVAVKIGDIGMISADYERVNYGNNKIEEKNDYSYDLNILNGLNQTIDRNGSVSNNLRFGGEVRFGNFYGRAGYAYYQSPYKNDFSDFLSSRQQYSGGLGFRGNSVFIDATFVTSSYTEEQQLFSTIPNMSEVDFTNSRLIVSLGLRF